jgi:peptidoglycan/LPS O-acetylase OafA/YrhL
MYGEDDPALDQTMTISQQIVKSKGNSSGFDYVRLVLALSVVVFHTIPICYGLDVRWDVYMMALRPLTFIIVPGFFAVSGFLIAASFQRVNSIPVFLTLRAMRILPALFFVVFISAFLLGPLLTDLPLGTYLTDRSTWAYLLGGVGSTHYVLPGVFAKNPGDTVNGSLWTIPWELASYMTLPVMAVMTFVRRSRLMIVAAVALNVSAYEWSHFLGHLDAWDKPGGGFVVITFIWGAVLYINREKIPYSRWFCVLAFAAAYVSIWWSPAVAFLAPLPIAYASIFLGLQNPRKISPIRDRDFSYGIYLYGWPVQQTVVRLLPYGQVWYVNLVVSLVVTTAVAWLSWTFIESRVLNNKGKAARLVDSAWIRYRQLWWKLPERATPAPEVLTRGSANAPWMRSGQDAA